MLDKISNIQPCFHESEDELAHFVSCHHSDVLGYDRDGNSSHIDDIVQKLEQKEELLTSYEIGTRRENSEDLAKFEELFNAQPSESVNYFENYIDIDHIDVYSIQLQLKTILKDKYENYEKILRSWFSSEIDYQQFDRSINLLLPKISMKKIHNDYMMAIFQRANNCDNNVIDEFSHFFDDLIDGSDLEKIYSSDKNTFSDIIISNNGDDVDTSIQQERETKPYESNETIMEQQKLQSSSINNDEDDDLLMVVKKRKRKRYVKIFDDDDNINNERSETENHNNNNNDNDLDNHLSDDDLNAITKKKKKRKALLIESSDEEEKEDNDGNDGTMIFYDTESSSNSNVNLSPSSMNDLQQTFDAKSSGPLKTTITIMNNNSFQRQNNGSNQQKNFSLLSKILNSETSIPHLEHSNSSSSISYRNLNSTIEPVTYCFNEPSKNQSSSSSSFPSSFIMGNSKIAELLNYKMPENNNDDDYQNEENNFQQYSSSQLSTSPPPNISTTLDSLSNSDDASQKSDNNNYYYYEWNDPSTLSCKSHHQQSKVESLNHHNQIANKTMHSFEIFDPMMDQTLDDQQQNHHLIKNYDSNNDVDDDDDDVENVQSMNNNGDQNTYDQLLKGMSCEEKMNKLKTCYQEIALPDNVRLGLRISQLATLRGFKAVDRKVTQLCNVALKVSDKIIKNN